MNNARKYISFILLLKKVVGHAVKRAELEDNPATPRGVYVSLDAVGTPEGSLIDALAHVSGVAAAGMIALAGGLLGAGGKP